MNSLTKSFSHLITIVCIFSIQACGESDEPKSGKFDSNGHEYVDLGLSVKWATCNVGAEDPQEIGNLYSWGEMLSKDKYTNKNYRYFEFNDNLLVTKYCTKSSKGNVDNKTRLDPEDDVIRLEMGGDWRMPSREEVNELVRFCTIKRDTVSDVPGVLVTGPNGNSIFVPGKTADVYDSYTRNRYGEWEYKRVQSDNDGGFWTSDLFTSYEQADRYAYAFKFNTNIRGGGVAIESNSIGLRYYGFACRGVIE